MWHSRSAIGWSNIADGLEEACNQRKNTPKFHFEMPQKLSRLLFYEPNFKFLRWKVEPHNLLHNLLQKTEP